MSTVRKAVITAAGHGTRQYPASATVPKEMFPLVDRDGITKPAIQIIAEEAYASGIQEICIITAPGAEEQFRAHFQPLSANDEAAYADKPAALQQSELLGRLGEIISYVAQPSPEGYGHAVYCARQFVGDEPFLLLLGDHLYISDHQQRCACQLIDVFESHQQNVSAVQVTPSDQLHLFGTVKGEPLADHPGVYQVLAMKEKPSVDYARQHLSTPGLPADHYLCFFGMYILTRAIFDCLEEHIQGNIRERGEIQLTGALEALRQREPYLAYVVQGSRYDLGVPEGLVATQTALALCSPYARVVTDAVERTK